MADSKERASAQLAPDLIDRLIARDAAAFEELVRTHGPRMLAVATRYLRRPADAEDALQDAFVNVIRSIATFRRASSIETWLHRIVVNCSLMSLRRRRRKPEAKLEEAGLEGPSASPWRRWLPPSAHEVAATEEMGRVVREAVDRLPDAERFVLLLRDVEALELKAIAQLLDVGISTVKLRLRRARHTLQNELGPQLAEHAR